ncbi:unnamed protein product, partial [Sphacelaria rigidula]
GDPGGDGFDCDSLERCIDEFFHEGHGLDTALLWVVVMAPNAPGPEIRNLLQSPKFMSRVRYFHGSVTDPRDMAAVCAEYADCIFLFPNLRPGGDVRAAEERVTLAAKALRRYLDHTPTNEALMSKVKMLSETGVPRRTVVTVEELRSKDQLLGFGIDHVICHDEIKMAMLACGTLCPSFLPFVVNTVRSGNGHSGHSGHSGRGEKEGRSGDRSGYASSSWERKAGRSGWLFGSGSRLGGKKKAHGNQRAQDHAVIDGNVEIPAAVRISRSRSKSGGHRDGGSVWRKKKDKGWLEDYTDGAAFKLYSIPLDDLPSDSGLWGMSFRRAALTVYGDSGGKVLLLAAVEDMSISCAYGGAGGGLYRPNNGSGSNRGGWVDHVEVEVLPGRGFRFTQSCHLLVLAETKRLAEEWIFDLQHDAYPDDTEATIDARSSSTEFSSFSTHPQSHYHQPPPPPPPPPTAQAQSSPFSGNLLPLPAAGSSAAKVAPRPATVATRVATVDRSGPDVDGVSGGSGGANHFPNNTSNDINSNRSIGSPTLETPPSAAHGSTSAVSAVSASVALSALETTATGAREESSTYTSIAAAPATSAAETLFVPPTTSPQAPVAPPPAVANAITNDGVAVGGAAATAEAAMLPPPLSPMVSISRSPKTSSAASPVATDVTATVNSFSGAPTMTSSTSQGLVTFKGAARSSPPPTGVRRCPQSPAQHAARALPTVLSSPHSSISGGVGERGGLLAVSAVSQQRKSWAGLQLDEETLLLLENFRRESNREEGVNWMRALDALKQAKAQLVELEEQSAFDGDELARAVHMSNDPAAFFSKVERVAESVANALRIH